jgi:hypothetical protein
MRGPRAPRRAPVRYAYSKSREAWACVDLETRTGISSTLPINYMYILCFVIMVPLLPPINNCVYNLFRSRPVISSVHNDVEDSWGWRLHATSAQLAARQATHE